MMEGRIILLKNRLFLWPFTTQRKLLLHEILEDSAVRGSLKHVREDNLIHCICWQYLISLFTLQRGNLGRSYPSLHKKAIKPLFSVTVYPFSQFEKAFRTLQSYTPAARLSHKQIMRRLFLLCLKLLSHNFWIPILRNIS
jgi:hypothetical protein